MRDETAKTYKTKLEAMREKELESSRTLREGLRSPLMDSIGELSLYDNHPADVGDATFEREKDLGLKLFAEDRVRMIEDALDRIETGEYGRCEMCGQKISAARLEAIPYTTLCQSCKRERESAADFHRPVEEVVIDRNNNAFDGEDSWQAVARYGTSNSPPELEILDEEE